jgi:outer membrane protein TolC
LSVKKKQENQTKEIFSQALVNLDKAMGGGWVLETDQLTSTTTGS